MPKTEYSQTFQTSSVAPITRSQSREVAANSDIQPTKTPAGSLARDQSPTIEETIEPDQTSDPEAKMDTEDTIQQLRAQLKIMQEQMATMMRQPERESTPETSAFSGTQFQATGVAAKAAFKTLGARNHEYDDKAKARAKDPEPFEGSEKTFDQWVTALADKFEEDVTTFRNEKSRMRYLMASLKGQARSTLGPRYDNEKFTCVAEMMQVLSSIYHDPNKASKARAQLRKLMFRPSKDETVHQFIGQFNQLAHDANVRDDDLKGTLLDHFPAHMIDRRLVTASKDATTSYETFCSWVADAAHVNQRAWEQRQSRSGPSTRTSGGKGATTTTNRKAATDGARKLTEAEKKKHWEDGTCFSCGKTGHIAKDCLHRDEVRAIKEIEEDGELKNE